MLKKEICLNILVRLSHMLERTKNINLAIKSMQSNHVEACLANSILNVFANQFLVDVEKNSCFVNCYWLNFLDGLSKWFAKYHYTIMSICSLSYHFNFEMFITCKITITFATNRIERFIAQLSIPCWVSGAVNMTSFTKCFTWNRLNKHFRMISIEYLYLLHVIRQLQSKIDLLMINQLMASDEVNLANSD